MPLCRVNAILASAKPCVKKKLALITKAVVALALAGSGFAIGRSAGERDLEPLARATTTRQNLLVAKCPDSGQEYKAAPGGELRLLWLSASTPAVTASVAVTSRSASG